jgi:hypothetical protein
MRHLAAVRQQRIFTLGTVSITSAEKAYQHGAQFIFIMYFREPEGYPYGTTLAGKLFRPSPLRRSSPARPARRPPW